MILSSYRNPPYRSPTPKTSTSPPPPTGPSHPSPKRKRSDSGSRSDEILRIETANLRDEAQESVSGCDSPRSKVAEKFRDLDLDRLRLENDGGDGGGEGLKRKRLKRNPPVRGLVKSPVKEIVVAETPEATARLGTGLLEDPVEIQETPQVQRTPSSSPSEVHGDAAENFRKACQSLLQTKEGTGLADRSPSSTPLPPSPRVLISPPPPPSSSPQTPATQPPIPDRALSPLPTRLSTTKDLSPTPEIDRASLTWQDSEITGHEIDSLLGDDGLGINGIGFRPTPAMAYARAQKRKAQVSEWKAREAREARQRRMERRRGAEMEAEKLDTGDDGVGERRIVRFEVEDGG